MRLRLRALFHRLGRAAGAWRLPFAILATEVGGPLLGLVLGGITGLLAASAIERPLRALARVAERIAGGDRYAIVPKQPKGPLSELAEAAESLRAAVIKADSIAVDQRRCEAEARLHYAGRNFFTRPFRSAVDEVTNAFADGSGRIGNTAADLAERNRHMHVRIGSASDAAESASEDVNAIAASARSILARIRRSAGDIGISRAASDRAVADLVSADETVRGLGKPPSASARWSRGKPLCLRSMPASSRCARANRARASPWWRAA